MTAPWVRGEGVPIPPEAVPWTQHKFDALLADLEAGRLDEFDLQDLEDQVNFARAKRRERASHDSQ